MQIELEETFFYVYRPRLGDVVVEVGAGAGGETEDLARLVGPEGSVLAIEAHPVCFDMLERSAKPANVAIINAATLRKRGRAWISDDGSLLRDHIVPADYPNALPVPARTLDELTAVLERIDYLKMNIEGSEVEALQGGSETLSKTSNVVIACHDFLGMPTMAEVDAILREAGFSVSERSDPPDSCRACYLYGSREEVVR